MLFLLVYDNSKNHGLYLHFLKKVNIVQVFTIFIIFKIIYPQPLSMSSYYFQWKFPYFYDNIPETIHR